MRLPCSLSVATGKRWARSASTKHPTPVSVRSFSLKSTRSSAPPSKRRSSTGPPSDACTSCAQERMPASPRPAPGKQTAPRGPPGGAPGGAPGGPGHCPLGKGIGGAPGGQAPGGGGMPQAPGGAKGGGGICQAPGGRSPCPGSGGGNGSGGSCGRRRRERERRRSSGLVPEVGLAEVGLAAADPAAFAEGGGPPTGGYQEVSPVA
mmetsp:Transcript_70250/g.155358  ORF Transcript_70250/g.155358 Transcript_70250/m.155358 type:complete len:206 (-) Transcript_70250:876-1493(-)